MMIKIIFFISATLLIVSNLMYSQEKSIMLLDLGQGNYYDGQNEGPLHKFGHVFQEDPETKILFYKFNRSRKAQRFFNLIGGILGGFIFASATLSADDDQNLRGQFQAFGIGLGAFFVLPANALGGTRKRKHKRELQAYMAKNK